MKKVILALTLITSIADANLTISGISSGGFMAAQMATIYSDQFSGVGTVAGGFYFCAQDYFQKKMKEARLVGTYNLSLFQTRVDNEHLFSGKPREIIGLDPKNPMYQAIDICMRDPAKAELPDKA